MFNNLHSPIRSKLTVTRATPHPLGPGRADVRARTVPCRHFNILRTVTFSAAANKIKFKIYLAPHPGQNGEPHAATTQQTGSDILFTQIYYGTISENQNIY